MAFDGGDAVTLLELTPDTPTGYNETVSLSLNNPAGANTAVVTWDHQGHNNWWWAIDNIMVTGESGPSGVDGLSSLVTGLSTQALESLVAHYDGTNWSRRPMENLSFHGPRLMRMVILWMA